MEKQTSRTSNKITKALNGSHKPAGRDDKGPIIIKKYANRRLYNTSTSSYVTLEDLSCMIKEGSSFVVKDAKSSEDITRSVLTQIIFEEESKGNNLLPVKFLEDLIKFYDDSMQVFVPSYLEMAMGSLVKEQDKYRNKLADSFSPAHSINMLEEMTKKNMEIFENTMKLFTPFSSSSISPATTEASTKQSDDPTQVEARQQMEIEGLKSQLDSIKKSLDNISNK